MENNSSFNDKENVSIENMTNIHNTKEKNISHLVSSIEKLKKTNNSLEKTYIISQNQLIEVKKLKIKYISLQN